MNYIPPLSIIKYKHSRLTKYWMCIHCRRLQFLVNGINGNSVSSYAYLHIVMGLDKSFPNLASHSTIFRVSFQSLLINVNGHLRLREHIFMFRLSNKMRASKPDWASPLNKQMHSICRSVNIPTIVFEQILLNNIFWWQMPYSVQLSSSYPFERRYRKGLYVIHKVI